MTTSVENSENMALENSASKPTESISRKERMKLVSAAVTRFAWQLVILVLLLNFELPLGDFLLILVAVHTVANIFGTWSFWSGRFVTFFIYLLITGDVLAILAAILASGFYYSPFIVLLPMQASMVVLAVHLRAGYWAAALGSVVYIAMLIAAGQGFIRVDFTPSVGIVWGHGIFVPTSIFTSILVMHFIGTRLEKSEMEAVAKGQELEEKNENLEKSYAEIQSLKHQQDGDYFLTARLVKPLAVNAVEGGNVLADYYIRQYKRFQFKKWNEEIGGDICIVHKIILSGREYVVFLNADAMGKSIQGAGGALVLGSIFQAILERTHRLRLKIPPESWLQEIVTEISAVFMTFDGGMLISLVLGLVDTQTGMMYYLNAEHPWTVLYRKRQAVFIEKEMSCRKLGMEQSSGVIVVKTLQLEEGDVVIAGSDGRDDIILADGTVNEDENLFLNWVQEAQGRLDEIATSITSAAGLKDDLSFIRLEVAACPLAPAEASDKSQLIAAYKAKDYAGVVKSYEEGPVHYDNEPNALLAVADSFAKVGDNAKALFVAEKLLFRPSPPPGAFQLGAKLYRRFGNEQRVQVYGPPAGRIGL